MGDFSEEDIESCILDYLGTISATTGSEKAQRYHPIIFHQCPPSLHFQQVRTNAILNHHFFLHTSSISVLKIWVLHKHQWGAQALMLSRLSSSVQTSLYSSMDYINMRTCTISKDFKFNDFIL